MSGSPGGPATVANQTGQMGQAVGWINSAWLEIQTMHDDWEFMRSSVLLGGGCSFATAAGQTFAPLGTGVGTCGVPAAAFGKWHIYTFRSFTTTVGFRDELRLDPVSFDSWREDYMYGAQRSTVTRPVAVAIGPDRSVCFGPPSNGLYTITGDYYVAPTLMALDTDVPFGLPAQFHMLIVWKALLDYGGNEAASEVIARAEMHVEAMLGELAHGWMPTITLAGAL